MKRHLGRWLLSGAVATLVGAPFLLMAQNVGASPSIAADPALCFPNAAGDYVHRSSTGVAASAHGWWTEGTCSAPFGSVTIDLWEFWLSDSSWHKMGPGGDGVFRPGGGSGNWAVARQDCRSTANRTWHSVIHVSVGGEQYGQDKTTTANRTVACVA